MTARHRPSGANAEAGSAPHALPPALLHDLRSPLTQILGYSQMMLEQAREEQQAAFASDLQKVQAAGRQLLELIDARFCVPGASAQAHTTSPQAGTPIASNGTHPPGMAIHNVSRTAAEGGRVPDPVQGRLLVVDDSAANREMLSRQLERLGYSVSTAEYGRQALDAVREQPFDMVLLDILMPEMDGYEVLRELKADDALRHIPVVMISALSEFESVIRCIELGADDYLPQPFDPTLLRARVGACLDKKRAHDRESRITEDLRASYLRLQELEHLRDDLMHMIVHDLRTPLSSVMVGMQSLEAVGDLNDSQREVLQIALGGGNALLGMINDLLDVDKMESGSMLLEYAELAAADLVAGAISQVAQLARSSQLTLVEQVAADLPHFEGDVDKLRRVLVNLLGNAVKFSPTGGAITVRVRLGDDAPSLRFSVCDTGEGIPPEACERIFDKFAQVESRHAGHRMSTGLGLAFCKLAVEAHGGRLWVESELGTGSTFYFVVPLQPTSKPA